MEKFDSDKRYHVAAIVLIDIKKQTELLFDNDVISEHLLLYWKLSCCIENSLKIFFILLIIFCKQNGLFVRDVFFTSVPQQPII